MNLSAVKPYNLPHRIILFLSALLFVGCARFGLLIAEHKELWNDEIYSQESSVKRTSYRDMFLGRIQEGNNSPLFYVLQKTIWNIFSDKQETHEQGYTSKKDKIILRLNPVFFMSLAIMIIFYYFARFYGLWMGFFSLLIIFSTAPVWHFWVEARPYALWFCLTTVELLCFLNFIHRQEMPASVIARSECNERRSNLERKIAALPSVARNDTQVLAIIHLLLSFTVIFSVVQIFIVSFLLKIYRKIEWKDLWLVAVIPIGIALFYYYHAPKYSFWFLFTPEQLIRDCFSRERFYILFLFVLFLGFYFVQTRLTKAKFLNGEALYNEIPILSVTGLMLAAAFFILFIFTLKANQVQNGFIVSSRYFMYLAPVGIISTVLLSRAIVQSLSNDRWLQMIFTIGIAYWIIHRGIKLWPTVREILAVVANLSIAPPGWLI